MRWLCIALLVSACDGPAGGGSMQGDGGDGSADGPQQQPGGLCTEPVTPGEMVMVPAGPFQMGCNPAIQTDCDADESPYHTVTLSAFEIDRTEVTQHDYKACMDAGACEIIGPANQDNWPATLPVVDATWNGATQYCAWVGKRLPTEAEWEKAARGTDGRKFPWGNSDWQGDCVFDDVRQCMSCRVAGQAVGQARRGASPYGALDMFGGLYEWVADYYQPDYYATSPAQDPSGPASGACTGVGTTGCRVLRGFASDNLNTAIVGSVSGRDAFAPMWSTPLLGFRCAR